MAGKNLYAELPDTPGIYKFLDVESRVLYVGKAANLRRRVSSYFLRPQEARLEEMLRRVKRVSTEETPTALEALILEAQRIKELRPPFNVREKDDKSFLYIEITKDKIPQVILVRGKSKPNGKRFGPFTSAQSVRAALRILRRIFPFNTHPATEINKRKRPCFDYEIGQCPGACAGLLDVPEYKRNLARLKLFLHGKRTRLVQSLRREMESAAKKLDFERAEKLRRQLFALEHIQDVALLQAEEERGESGLRLEGYDISNISGTSAVGSMVVFSGNRPARDQYRKFKIRTLKQANDVGMLREVLSRRLEHEEWRLPDLILVDGGRGQVNATKSVLRGKGLSLPVIGMAKGPKRKKTEIIGKTPENVPLKTLIQMRDEAHRFAVSYHRRVRASRSLFG